MTQDQTLAFSLSLIYITEHEKLLSQFETDIFNKLAGLYVFLMTVVALRM